MFGLSLCMNKVKQTKSITKIENGDMIFFHGATYKATSRAYLKEEWEGMNIFKFNVVRVDDKNIRGMNDELSMITEFTGFHHKKITIA